jgi:L-alanine-DL-glutamate epimerase-like enolase superfamily enzyme
LDGARPLRIPLVAPFTIVSSRLTALSNVAVRVELRSGAVDWGEAPVLPSVTAGDQLAALGTAGRACAAMPRRGRSGRCVSQSGTHTSPRLLGHAHGPPAPAPAEVKLAR